MPEHRIAASAPAEPAPTVGSSLRLPALLVDSLFGQAAVPAEWQLSRERFARALERSATQRFRGAQPAAGQVVTYFESLHLSDLALACACSEGAESAWEHFVREYRPELYRAARAIAGESLGRELADSLYAELYGLEECGGRRRSLFDYFHGRSKLSTWLRAVLAQRHVDELRRVKNTEPLDEMKDCDPSAGESANWNPAQDPERERYLALMQAALSETLAALEPRDRLRLAYYYVEELTLAQIGRLVGEHEATVSRNLDRTRRELREQIDATLREKRRLSEAQVRLCYEYASQEWPFDLTKALSARE